MDSYVEMIAKNTKSALTHLNRLDGYVKNRVLLDLRDMLDKKRNQIIQANKEDLNQAEKKQLSSALLDRLVLNDKRIDAMMNGLSVIARLKNPIGKVIKGYTTENGLNIEKTRVPIGVIGIIYESRPNVTVDAFSLCFKSSNCVILKGGSESINTNRLLVSLTKDALRKNNLDEKCVGFIDKTERQVVLDMIYLDKYIDLIIPRGGASLIDFVSKNSKIPIIKHDKGLCHIFVDEYGDIQKAVNVSYNAKVQRPGVCNAMETLLVHKNIANDFLPLMEKLYKKAGVKLKGCENTKAILPEVEDAVEDDWNSEYLDLILSIKIVNSLQEAIDHINRYGSKHSEAIMTENYTNAEKFLNQVDAACVYVNASTRFTDGFMFGMGAEIGISTNKLHARGPMALEELTTYKYKIRGNGQTRE